MEYPVTIKTLPGRYVASIRRRIANYWQEQELWTALREETGGMGLRVSEPAYAMAVFHDGEYVERDPDVEIQLAVEGRYPDTASVRFKTVPPMSIASATFRGPYEQMPAVTQAVAQWVRDNGYTFDGPSFFLYHVSPNEASSPEEYVTEVGFSVRKA